MPRHHTPISHNPLPVEVVFHPSWWHRHAGIGFDEDFFYHPARRVEDEARMERFLHERFGHLGLGDHHREVRPEVGAVHLAAGYLIQEMLGCRVDYREDAPPQVIPAGMERLDVHPDMAFSSGVFKKLQRLIESLRSRHGHVTGDINWGGVLNVALDLAGDRVFTGFYTDPEETARQFQAIADVIRRFASGISALTGTTSISVNRNVRHLARPVFLHSECTHTMISTEQYEQFLLPVDLAWSAAFRPFGIHYCGRDPHRFAESFSKIPNLDFLDVGWGGDVALLRRHLPDTFLNIRLDPVTLNDHSETELEQTIIRLVKESENPYLTGICCINMDDRTLDSRVETILRTVVGLRNKVTSEE